LSFRLHGCPLAFALKATFYRRTGAGHPGALIDQAAFVNGSERISHRLWAFSMSADLLTLIVSTVPGGRAMSEAPKSEGDAVEAIAAQGLALHQAGRLAEAKQHYDAALAVNPHHFSALHLLGVLCIQTGQLEQGVELIRRAIGIKPDVAAAYGDLATALNSLKRHDEALWSCDRAIALDPDYAAAHGNRGGALYQLGRLEEALASYRRQVALRPADARAHFNQAIMLRELGRLEEALGSFDQAIALKPDNADAHRNRGVALHELGRLDEALESHGQAIALRSESAEAHYNLGTTLLELRRPRDALTSFDQAIALRSNYAEAHSNRGVALNDLERYEEALVSFEQAIVLKPDHARAYCNKVISLQELRRPQEALESCDRAIALKPDYAEAHYNRASVFYGFRRLEEAVANCDRAIALKPIFAEAYDGRAVALHELGLMADALAGFERAIELKPGYAEAHHHMAMCRLALGDYAKGWPQYEWRWETRQFEHGRRDLDAPLWLGREDLRGRTILLHAEQGLGDTLQFCRYVPNVAALGAKVILEVQPGLERLLSRLDGVDHILTRGAALPPYDFQTPLASLPLALDAGPDGDLGPYLLADPERAVAWASRLSEAEGLRVGLCWAGGTRLDQRSSNAIDQRRSLPLEAFTPLADIPGVQIYSLQMGPPAGQLTEAQARGWPGPPIIDLTAELKDFADTADLVANLDLVITCDTSTAHLAGALGIPVWILNRFDSCWRWLDGRDDSPWYRSARLFRQTAPGDWMSVVEQVKSQLLSLSAGSKTR
jgi:tetratricopeptide (TPR) repeat protein